MTEGIVQMAAFNPHDGTGFAKCYDVKNLKPWTFLRKLRQYPDIKFISFGITSLLIKAQRDIMP